MKQNVNTALYDNIVDRAAMMRLYEERVSGKIYTIVNGHKTKIDDIILRNKASMSPKMMEEIDVLLRKTYGQAYNVSSRSLLDLVSSQISYTYQQLDNAVGKIWRTSKPQYRIAEDIVLKRPIYNDVTLLEGWNTVSLSERKRLEAVIRNGIAQGLDEKAIALSIRKGNVLDISMNQSLGLVRTAMTSVRSQTDHEVYKANEKVLRGWQYVAVLDSRTTPICRHRDGTVYPISDVSHLPPAHFHCRSTTVPIVKSYSDLGSLENIAQIRKRNLEGLTAKQIAYYDGQSPLKESYSEWLQRQPTEVQLRHLGDTTRLNMFRSGQLTVDKFTNPSGKEVGIAELRRMTTSGIGLPGDTMKFAAAKERLDVLKLGASRPDEILASTELQKALKEYYLLQSRDLEGTLSLTNYRGNLLGTKKASKTRILSTPPNEDQLLFNPLTGRYEDSRVFQPNPSVLSNSYRLVNESADLKQADKDFIIKFVDKLEDEMSSNERAVVTENLRITFTRFRNNKEPWQNLKAVLNGQMKFDVMNVSDFMETQLRRNTGLLQRLKQDNFLDPVLGPSQLDELHDEFLANIKRKNKWEDKTLPKIARELRNVLDRKIPLKLLVRLEEPQKKQFYLKFANRLALADGPDRDQLAVAIGRDLYNLANYRGSRQEWWKLGVKLLDDAKGKGFYELETFGVQKRRMKSKNSNKYFGPAYDTFSVHLRIVDKRIQDYSKLTRKVDVGIRVTPIDARNRLIIREGYKTYFIDEGVLGYYDTRIPITSTDSFADFPEALIDKSMTQALNWAGRTEYRIDNEFYDFINKLMLFEDDKGRAKHYNELNTYREYMVERGDAYERFKVMDWLRKKNASFSNIPFLDHRARIYERGFIGPQSGESFRPFLNSKEAKPFSEAGWRNLNDQIGGFLGGLSDKFEGRHNSLSVTGRQLIASELRPEMVKIGNHILRGKPGDIRAVLDSKFVQEIDGEDLGKALRLSLEAAKIHNFLDGKYDKLSLAKLSDYKIAIALEQDASSSGAQIIALTTKNKQLAELSNVVPTNQKKRLYDEIAARTFDDPRFIKLNQKLGLTEKDLRKAAKAQNMVTFYGAGERTGIINVETKLAKALDKQDSTLVVKASDRDTVLEQISARAARFERFDPDTAAELKSLRQDVKDIFNKGIDPGDDILEELWFLEPKTYDLVEKMSRNYNKVVTPDDFKLIANIMSENLSEEVPILKGFTKFFGRLAADFLTSAKPSQSSLDFAVIARQMVFGNYSSGDKLSPLAAEILGTKASESLSEKLLKRIPWFKPDSTFSDIVFGVKDPIDRVTGKNLGKVKFKLGDIEENLFGGFDVLHPNKLPKNWTNVPVVNFDGKVVEQKFTQSFEEKLLYKSKDGEWITNIVQVKQKTDPTWWQEIRNKSDTMQDIADLNKAKTAFGVNTNHSNDAVLVKKYHLWGRRNNIDTSTVHDAFLSNAADMLKARDALREIYAESLESNVILHTLNEMRARGLPKDLYDQYLNEAIDTGLIPVPGRSVVGGKVLQIEDILTREDILKPIEHKFDKNLYWYGIG